MTHAAQSAMLGSHERILVALTKKVTRLSRWLEQSAPMDPNFSPASMESLEAHTIDGDLER